MRIRTLIGLAVAAAVALVLAMPASAQTPAPSTQKQTQEQVRSPIEGDLVSVDADTKEITIKPASGPNLVIDYTDKTEISGAQKDAAGLATLKDARVTVHFTEDAQTKARTATRIIVQAKK